MSTPEKSLPNAVPKVSANISSENANNNTQNIDQKDSIKKLKIIELEESKARKKLRRIVETESKRITKVIVPISLCMLIVIVSINFFSIFSTNPLEEVAKEVGMGKVYETRDASATSKIVSAIVLAIAFLIMLAIVTFCMAVVIIYRFETFILGFFIFSFVIYFGVLGTAFLSVAVYEYNVPIDWLTVIFIVYNYTGLGLVTFFINGPKLLRQMFLIVLSSNVALVLITIIPDWTTWLLLVVMALWDCYAVLHETGPLNQIFNADHGQKLPPILYTTAVWLEVSQSESDSGNLEIGLGDFVFYSLLVGKSFSSGDFITAIICFICILVGLAITLFILLLKNMPLPALPISIALGLIANFTTKFLVIPFNDVLTEKQIFI